MIAITAVDKNNLPLTKNEVRPNSNRNPPRTVHITALDRYQLQRSDCRCKSHSHLSLLVDGHQCRGHGTGDD